MLMRDGIVNDGTICPVNIVGRPGILISHTCVDWIFLLSGKLIVRGDTVIRLFHGGTIHDEDGSHACVCNCLVGCNC
jgi:hypothetical protein